MYWQNNVLARRTENWTEWEGILVVDFLPLMIMGHKFSVFLLEHLGTTSHTANLSSVQKQLILFTVSRRGYTCTGARIPV